QRGDLPAFRGVSSRPSNDAWQYDFADQVDRPNALIGPGVVTRSHDHDELKIREQKQPLVAIADATEPSTPATFDRRIGAQLAQIPMISVLAVLIDGDGRRERRLQPRQRYD